MFPAAPLGSVELELRDYLRADFVLGIDAAFGAGSAELPLSTGERLTYAFREYGLGVSILKEWSGGALVPFAGIRLGMFMINRSFRDVGVRSQDYAAITPGLCAGVRFRLTERFSVSGRGRLHYLYYHVDRPQSLGYAEGAGLATWEF